MSLRAICVKKPVPALKIVLPTLLPLKFAFIREIRGQKNSRSRRSRLKNLRNLHKICAMLNVASLGMR